MKVVAAALLVVCVVSCTARANDTSLRDGDIVFQTSRSAQSLAIQKATASPYSHVGIVFIRDGKPFVFEAVATVQYTPLPQWIAQGEGERFVVKRLRNAAAMTADAIAKLRLETKKFEGRRYDLAFEWSDERIYCSELVWKLYDRVLGIQLGQLQKLREFHLSDPVVKAKLRERYGSAIPMDEPVIAPAAMFDSPLLETVSN